MSNQYRPSEVPPPGETLEELLQERGLTQADLAQRMGRTPKHINEIINKGAPITPETALQLERALGGPSARFWNNLEALYREWLADAEEQQRLEQDDYEEWARSFPVSDMVRHRWIERSSSRDWADKAEKLLTYFGVVSPDAWRDVWSSRRLQVAFRRNVNFTNAPEAVAVWLRHGELVADSIRTNPFDEEVFEWCLHSIRTATRLEPHEAERAMLETCAEAGVAVVRTPKIVGAPIAGATRWLRPDKALIQLSGRGRFEDQFWFTFFHEAGHILLHGKRKVFVEPDRQEKGGKPVEEEEADRFAADFLIAPDDWLSFTSGKEYYSQGDIEDFAEQLDICPAVVVGRLQKEGRVPHSNLNALKRKMPEESGALV